MSSADSHEFTPLNAGDAPFTHKPIFGYNVLELLGRGAGSHLYAVSDPETHQVYALKHVIREEDKDIRFIEQLEAEYEVSHHFSHAALRRSFDLKINKTLLRRVTEAALIMELVDGTPLEYRLPKSLGSLVKVFIQTAYALDAMHHAGYIHCDLKPNNIMVNNARVVKLIDFGQTCKVGTVKERIQGTPDFIAPEQVKCEPLSVRTDIFNFGATLYWALSGGKKIPTLYTLKKSSNSFLLDAGIPAPHELNPLVPESLSHLTMDCVKTNPAKRPASIGEIAHRLEIMAHAIRRMNQN